MERFLGALSITLLLSGWAAVTQFQSSQLPVAQAVQAELSISHPVAPSSAPLDRSELISILAKALQLNRSQADHSSFDWVNHSQASRQVSVVPIQGMSPFDEAYSDIQIVLHNGMSQYREGRFYLKQGGTQTKVFLPFAQSHDLK